MSNPNINLSNLDSRYASPSQVDSKIAAQAAVEVGLYSSKSIDIYVRDYGAKGDGSTDDAPAWRSALAAAETAALGLTSFTRMQVVVHGDNHAVYRIASSISTTSWYMPSGNVQTRSYCLAIASNVAIDLHDGLFQHAAGDSTLVCNKGATTNSSYTTFDTNVAFRGRVDGANITRTLGFGLIHFVGIDRWELNATVTNVNGIAIQLFNCQNGRSALIDIDTVVGVGLGLGQYSPSGQEVRSSRLDVIRVRNVTVNSVNTFNYPGNPIAGSLQAQSSIGLIDAANCTAGIKFDNLSADFSITQVIGKNLGDSQGNSGIKLQGVSGRPVSRVWIGSIQMTGCSAHGLYADYTQDVSIGSYWGSGNQTLGTGPDVWIGGNRDHITSIKSDASGGDGVLLRAYAADAWIGKISVRNPGQVTSSTSGQGLAVTAGGTGSVGELYAVDDQATTLSATLSTSGSITALPVVATTVALASGATVIVTSSSYTQTFTLSAATAIGATSLPITSATPTYAFPSGSVVTTPTMIHGLGIAATSLFFVGKYKVFGSRGNNIAVTTGLVQNVVAQNGPPVVGSVGIPTAASLTDGQAVRQQIRVGQYYSAIPASGYTTGNGVGNSALRLAPWPVPRVLGLASISATVSTAGDTGTTLRLGLYSDDGTGYPGALVQDFGTITADSTGTKEILINPTTFPSNSSITTTGLALLGGTYWIGGAIQAPLVTLTSAVATGTAITSLAVSAIPNALASGATVAVAIAGLSSQIFTLSAAASAGATSLTITSATPNYAYPSGTSAGVLSTVPTLYVVSGGIGAVSLGGSLPAGNAGTAAYSQTGVLAALPSTFTTSVAATGVVPRIFIKAGA